MIAYTVFCVGTLSNVLVESHTSHGLLHKCTSQEFGHGTPDSNPLEPWVHSDLLINFRVVMINIIDISLHRSFFFK